MLIPLVRFWGCALCDAHGIAEHCTEEPFWGEIPDQNNCDLSTYHDYHVVGGRLFAGLPRRPWKRADDVRQADDPRGGICHSCLAREDMRNLIASIRFA